MREAYEYGERKHETCRFGTLTPGYHIDARPALDGDPPRAETPIVLPLCNWKPAGDAPPALTRIWGGAVEFERDCAVCRAYQILP